MSWHFQKPRLKRNSSEQSPLLQRNNQTFYGAGECNLAGPPSPTDFPKNAQRGFGGNASSWKEVLRDVSQKPDNSGPLGIEYPVTNLSQHASSERRISADWLDNSAQDGPPRRGSESASGNYTSRSAKLSGWILATIVGVLVACVAYLVDISEIRLFDYKFGYCTKSITSTRRQCCSGSDSCSDWRSWGEIISQSHGHYTEPLNFVFYALLMMVLAGGSCALVILESHVVRPSDGDAVASWDIKTERQIQEPIGAEQPEGQHLESSNPKIYTCAGSGVAEVKVIASGFVIRGYLGPRTFFIKTVACILSVASGLSIGKEGPFVHLAACVGYITSRLFPAYSGNANRRRAIVSASSAAGLTVAFGTPIAGVLFSLEEVSYHFSSKLLFRTFYCATIAVVSLKLLNPEGKAVFLLFQVEEKLHWRVFQLIIFTLLGILGGATGALMIKGIRLWAKTFRSLSLVKTRPLLETLTIAIITACISYWNDLTRLPVGGLMEDLTGDCSLYGSNGNGLCPEEHQIPKLILYLIASFVIKGVLTTICFGLKIPAGIYMPSMAVGGLLGRAVGHLVQYTIAKFNNSGHLISCNLDAPEGCVVPGVYALVAAGATMCGVTRLSLTLAVMLFELTGSLEHVPTFSLAILASKWTADFLEPQSIYDFYLDRSDLPFLDNHRPPNFTSTLGDVMTAPMEGRNLDVTKAPWIQANVLRMKLNRLRESNQSDSGCPILDHGHLVGLISFQDLEHCLGRIPAWKDPPCLISPRFFQENTEEIGDERNPTDFTPYIDPAPLSLDIRTSNDFVYECFVKMGVRYVCVTRDGRFIGLLRKKVFVEYARQIGKGFSS